MHIEFKLDDPFSADIKYIWVGGMDVGCAGNYTRCARNQPMNISADIWAEKEPRRKGANANCILISMEGPNPGLALADCTFEYSYVCKMNRE